MAHSCPECDSVCHCGGDIDDVILEEGEATCTHCDDQESEYEEWDDWEDEDD